MRILKVNRLKMVYSPLGSIIRKIQRLLLNFVGFLFFAGVGIVSAITWTAAQEDDSGNSTRE